MNNSLKRNVWDAVVLTASVAAMSGILLADASAGEHRRTPHNEKYAAECGSCHVAYPPKLLPAQSWRSVMDGLSRHFGTDASVDTATAEQILAYLEQNAGRKQPPPAGGTPRITSTSWFVREHREVAAATWTNSGVKSRANCSACHTKAEAGSYREGEIRLPK
jgi:hypothetical protein